jgi:hypothetical protein
MDITIPVEEVELTAIVNVLRETLAEATVDEDGALSLTLGLGNANIYAEVVVGEARHFFVISAEDLITALWGLATEGDDYVLRA